MPIMIDSLSAISPTITLAELFEGQKHVLAAYTIYRYLSLTNPEFKQNETLKRVREKVFSIKESNKLNILSEIFTEEEADCLGILPTELYDSFKQTIDDLLNKEITEIDSVTGEEGRLFSNIEEQINTEWQEILSAEHKSFRNSSLQVDKIDWSSIKLSDFIEFLMKQTKKEDETLDKLKLSEIMKAFLNQYRDSNNE